MRVDISLGSQEHHLEDLDTALPCSILHQDLIRATNRLNQEHPLDSQPLELTDIHLEYKDITTHHILIRALIDMVHHMEVVAVIDL